jgi:hypothetical protein
MSYTDIPVAFRPYLEIFVDAAATIPLHRRAKWVWLMIFYLPRASQITPRLFLHLIKVLGPKDFTLPICLLLLGVPEISDMGTKRQLERNELASSILQSQEGSLRYKVSIMYSQLTYRDWMFWSGTLGPAGRLRDRGFITPHGGSQFPILSQVLRRAQW